jgi:hypothetical protein
MKQILGDSREIRVLVEIAFGEKAPCSWALILNQLHEKTKRGFSWTMSSLADTHRLEAICRLLGAQDHLLEYLFNLDLPQLRKSTKTLREGMGGDLSHGEQISIAAALDIWCGSSYLNLGDALNHWSDEELIRFIQALCHLREIMGAAVFGVRKVVKRLKQYRKYLKSRD